MDSGGGVLLDPAAGGIEIAEPKLYLPGGREHVIRDRPDIPIELLHLDIDEVGLATPWVSAGGAEGVPDRVRRAILERLCGICGLDLGYWLCWHVNAPDEAAARRCRHLFAAAIHPDTCSVYAERAYPAGGVWWRYVARSYKPRVAVDGRTVAQLPPAQRVERLNHPIDRSEG